MKELEKMLKSELIEKCLDLQGDLTASQRERRIIKEESESVSKGAEYLRDEAVDLHDRLKGIRQAIMTVAAMNYPDYDLYRHSGRNAFDSSLPTPTEQAPEEFLLLRYLLGMAAIDLAPNSVVDSSDWMRKAPEWR